LVVVGIHCDLVKDVGEIVTVFGKLQMAYVCIEGFVQLALLPG